MPMASSSSSSSSSSPIIQPEQPVLCCKSEDLHANTGQTGGMTRMAAFTDVNDKICASVMTAEPHTSSAIHHHGSNETVVYACSGHGSVVFGPDGSKRIDLAPGDFALIPSYTLHQEVNEGDEPVKWIITRTGRTPIVENVESWKDTVKVGAEAAAEDHMQGIPA